MKIFFLKKISFKGPKMNLSKVLISLISLKIIRAKMRYKKIFNRNKFYRSRLKMMSLNNILRNKKNNKL
jgi:hypothetical protein